MKDEKEKYISIMNLDGVAGIIRYISDHGIVNNIHLKFIIPNHYKLHNIMEMLRDNEIIELEFLTTPKRTYKYWLTEKGKKIAKKLDEIESILNEE